MCVLTLQKFGVGIQKGMGHRKGNILGIFYSLILDSLFVTVIMFATKKNEYHNTRLNAFCKWIIYLCNKNDNKMTMKKMPP